MIGRTCDLGIAAGMCWFAILTVFSATSNAQYKKQGTDDSPILVSDGSIKVQSGAYEPWSNGSDRTEGTFRKVGGRAFSVEIYNGNNSQTVDLTGQDWSLEVGYKIVQLEGKANKEEIKAKAFRHWQEIEITDANGRRIKVGVQAAYVLEDAILIVGSGSKQQTYFLTKACIHYCSNCNQQAQPCVDYSNPTPAPSPGP
jgi:hypothetical protein